MLLVCTVHYYELVKVIRVRDAMSYPMPLPPPVIRITLSWNSFVIAEGRQ